MQTLVNEVERLERRWKTWDVLQQTEKRRARNRSEAAEEGEATAMDVDRDDDDEADAGRGAGDDGMDNELRQAHLYISSSPP